MTKRERAIKTLNKKLQNRIRQFDKLMTKADQALLEAKRMYEELEPAGGWQGVYEQIESAIKKATE